MSYLLTQAIYISVFLSVNRLRDAGRIRKESEGDDSLANHISMIKGKNLIAEGDFLEILPEWRKRE